MSFPMRDYFLPTNPWDFVKHRQLGWDQRFRHERKNRPPLALEEFYCNSFAFSKDVFHVRSQKENREIPALCAGFAQHPNYPHLLALGDEEGVMYLIDTSPGRQQTGPHLLWSVANQAILNFKFLPDDPQTKIIAATGERVLILFDPHQGEELGTFVGHIGTVRCLDFQKDTGNNVFISGARDGHVILWDIRCGFKCADKTQQPVAFLANACSSEVDPVLKNRPCYKKPAPRFRGMMANYLKEINSATKGSEYKSVVDCVFQDRNVFITAGTPEGTIKMWDIRYLAEKPRPFRIFDLATSFTSFCLDSSRTRLFATAVDKQIYQIDVGPGMSPEPLASYSGALPTSYYVHCSLSADEELIACGSVDSKAYLFQVKKPEAPPVVLSGHKGEVLSVAFNPHDPYQFVTHADDSKVLLWRCEPFLDTSDKNQFDGEAYVDTQEIKPTKRRYSKPIFREGAIPEAKPKKTQKNAAAQKTPFRQNVPPSPSMAVQVPRTPLAGTQPKAKKMKVMTLSPFFKSKTAQKPD